MDSNGVMEEIRGLLNQGRSSSETIALGYKPSTVYKAQRQLRKVLSAPDPPVTTQVLVTNMASEDWAKLREENNTLREQVSSLEEVTAERDSLIADLDFATGQKEELVLEASQARVLQDHLSELEPEAQAAAELRQQVQDLQSHLSHSEAVMAQEVRRWQAGLQQEQVARREAEELVSYRSSEIDQLQAEKQRLAQQLEDLPSKIVPKVWEQIQPLQQETEELRLLKVWAGHPCSKCGKPTSGVPSREVAAKLLRDGGYGHGECVQKKSWW